MALEHKKEITKWFGRGILVLDCGGDHPRGAFEAAREGDGGIIVGYNVLHESTLWSGLRAHFLPIGEGSYGD